jgi:hypothetical protein
MIPDEGDHSGDRVRLQIRAFGSEHRAGRRGQRSDANALVPAKAVIGSDTISARMGAISRGRLFRCARNDRGSVHHDRYTNSGRADGS